MAKDKLIETKIFLTEKENKQLEKIAKESGHNKRKPFCEFEIRKIINERYKK